MTTPLEFEKGVAELEMRLGELNGRAGNGDKEAGREIERLQGRLTRLLQQSYRRLGPLQKLQVARHRDRPAGGAYIHALIDDFVPVLDAAAAGSAGGAIAGMGRFRGHSVAAVGLGGGAGGTSRDTDRDGRSPPRQIRRLLRLAEHFELPVLIFVHTTGDSAPGGVSPYRSIANMFAQAGLRLPSPVITIVTGVLAGADAACFLLVDRVLMLEHAVIYAKSPEALADDLWGDAAQTRAAAEALRITAADMIANGVADAVVGEPPGAAHRFAAEAIATTGDTIYAALRELEDIPGPRRLRLRHERVMALGAREAE